MKQYLTSGTRVLVDKVVLGTSIQATWVDTFYDGYLQMHVVRLDIPVHGFNYLTLNRYDFSY